MAILFIAFILCLLLCKDTMRAIINKAKRTKHRQDDNTADDLTQCDTMKELTEFIELMDEEDNENE